jgi:hypothetical protein
MTENQFTYKPNNRSVQAAVCLFGVYTEAFTSSINETDLTTILKSSSQLVSRQGFESYDKVLLG